MSDAPFIISPAGFIADVSFNTAPSPGNASAGLVPNIATGQSPNFGDTPTPGPWNVTQLLPGAIVQLVGGGQFNLTGQLGGSRGSMQVDMVAGTSVGSQGVAFLVGNLGPTTQYLGLSFSGGSPGLSIFDANGNEVLAGSTGSYAAGTPIQMKMFWNAVTGTSAFFINGVSVNFGFTNGPWAPFVPTAVLYGPAANGFGSFVAFNGKLIKVQVSNIGS